MRLLAAVFALVVSASVVRADDPQAARQRLTEEEQRVMALVAGVGDFRLLRAGPRGYVLGLFGADGSTLGALTLDREWGDPALRFRSRSFTISIGANPHDVDLFVHAARTVAERDDGSWVAQPRTPPPPPDREWFWWLLVQPGLIEWTSYFLIAAVVLGVWRRGAVSWELRIPHLLPAAIQLLILGYWSLYWPGVRQHMPSVAVEIVMAFAADAAFAFLRFGSWRIGASPLPIVLSTNLFAWFNTAGVVISIVTAFASKTLLRRGGRHVLNPSAIGLTVGGLIAMLAPGFVTFGGTFHQMNAAPNMAEVVFLLALLPQVRFRILPVSIAAVLALWSQGNTSALRPAMLLSLTLLATDPATIPRTDLGQVLFGALLGLTIPFASDILRSLGRADDFSKVLSIPLLNALVPVFDAVGTAAASLPSHLFAWLRTRAGGRVGRVLALGAELPRAAVYRQVPNLLLVGCWLLLVIPRFGEQKPEDFVPGLHWTWGTPLVVRDADDVPRCASNPVFCQPFTLLQEAALWRDRLWPWHAAANPDLRAADGAQRRDSADDNAVSGR